MVFKEGWSLGRDLILHERFTYKLGENLKRNCEGGGGGGESAVVVLTLTVRGSHSPECSFKFSFREFHCAQVTVVPLTMTMFEQERS